MGAALLSRLPPAGTDEDGRSDRRDSRRGAIGEIARVAIFAVTDGGEKKCRRLSPRFRRCGSASRCTRCVFDLAGKEQEASQLEQESTRPEFWLEQETAQAVMRRLTRLKEQISTWRNLEQ